DFPALEDARKLVEVSKVEAMEHQALGRDVAQLAGDRRVRSHIRTVWPQRVQCPVAVMTAAAVPSRRVKSTPLAALEPHGSGAAHGRIVRSERRAGQFR